MELVTYENVKTGQKVMLVFPDEEYDIGPANPVVGSEWECRGTIADYEPDGDGISVDWDNGTYNGYKENELALAKPSAEGRCQSIW